MAGVRRIQHPARGKKPARLIRVFNSRRQGRSLATPEKRDQIMTKQSLDTLSSLLRASYRTMICERPEDSHLTEISFLVHSDDVAAILKQMADRAVV